MIGRATMSMDPVHIDTTGPYPASLGWSRYIIMFVDSVSRLQLPYGVLAMSAFAILAVGKRFVAKMGAPRVFLTDNGTECTNGIFVDYCSLGIQRELTAPRTPQLNGPV